MTTLESILLAGCVVLPVLTGMACCIRTHQIRDEQEEDAVKSARADSFNTGWNGAHNRIGDYLDMTGKELSNLLLDKETAKSELQTIINTAK